MNRKIQIRKIIIFLISVVIAGLVFCIFSWGDSGQNAPQITLKCRVSYNNEITDDPMFVPVFVEITNNTDETQTGKVLLTTKYSYSFSDEEKIERYEEISLPPKVTKNITIPVYQSELANNRTATVSFINSWGRELAVDQPSFTYVGGRMCGFITESDSASKVRQYYSYLSQYDTTNYTRMIVTPITPSYFPTDENMLFSIPMLMIGECDFSGSSDFTEKQIEMMDAYVENGGTVVIGTGNDAGKTLSHFSKYFTKSTSELLTGKEETVILDVDFLRGNSKFYELFDETKDISVTAYLADCDDPNLYPVMYNSFGSKTALAYKHNDYNIYVTRFSLLDQDYIVSTGSAGALMSFVASPVFYNTNITYLYNYHLDSALDSMSFEKQPNILVVALIFLVYVFVLILVVYIILSKKKKTILFWITLPVAALLISVVLFVYGVALKGVGYSVTTISDVRIRENGLNQVNTYSKVKMTGNGNVKLSYTDGVYNYGKDFSSYVGERASDTYVSGGENYALVKSKGMWTYSDVSGETVNAKYGQFYIYIEEGTEEEGSGLRIKNNTGKDLSMVYVYYCRSTIYVGDLAKGESRSISPAAISYSFSLSPNELIYKAILEEKGMDLADASDYIRNMYGVEKVDNSDEDLRKAYLLYYSAMKIMNASDRDRLNIYVCGFDTDTDTSLSVNGRARRERSVSIIWQGFGAVSDEPVTVEIKSDLHDIQDLGDMNLRQDIYGNFYIPEEGRSIICYPFKLDGNVNNCDNMKISIDIMPFFGNMELNPKYYLYDFNDKNARKIAIDRAPEETDGRTLWKDLNENDLYKTNSYIEISVADPSDETGERCDSVGFYMSYQIPPGYYYSYDSKNPYINIDIAYSDASYILLIVVLDPDPNIPVGTVMVPTELTATIYVSYT